MRFSKVMEDNKQGSTPYFGQFLPPITQINTDKGSYSEESICVNLCNLWQLLFVSKEEILKTTKRNHEYHQYFQKGANVIRIDNYWIIIPCPGTCHRLVLQCSFYYLLVIRK